MSGYVDVAVTRIDSPLEFEQSGKLKSLNVFDAVFVVKVPVDLCAAVALSSETVSLEA